MDFMCVILSFVLAILILVNFFCIYGEKDLERQRNLIKVEVVLFFMFVGAALLSKLF